MQSTNFRICSEFNLEGRIEKGLLLGGLAELRKGNGIR